MYYFDVLKEFYDNEVDYLIVGGLAVNLHGIPRLTQDIDFVISFEKQNVIKINKIMKKLGYLPRMPVNPEELADDNKRTGAHSHRYEKK